MKYDYDDHDDQDDGIGYDYDEEQQQQPQQPQQPPRRWLIPFILTSITIISSVFGTIAGFTYEHHIGISKQQPFTLDKLFDETFESFTSDISWINGDGDGVYTRTDESGAIELVYLNDNTTKTLVKAGEVFDIDGNPLDLDSFTISPDLNFILLKSDTLQQFRHSSYANYHIHSIESNSTHPLHDLTSPPSISLAKWSPSGHSLVYCISNDLYLVHSRDVSKDPPQSVRITETGTDSTFNGVTDWVYEEEVFSTHDATWWNSASDLLAYLTLDEAKVGEYSIPIYNPTNSAENIAQYPEDLRIKYPQPGTPNPTVKLSVYSLVNSHTYTLNFPETRDDRLIIDVAWSSSKTLLVKETNRSSRQGSVVLFNFTHISPDAEYVEGVTVRDISPSDGGWIDCQQTIRGVEGVEGLEGSAYLDIVPNEQGYNHIAFYTSSNASLPIFLTGGQWEVEGVLAVSAVQRNVFFSAAYPTPIDRHILTVSLPTIDSKDDDNDSIAIESPVNLTDVSVPAKYSAAFNPDASFYTLNYEGPRVPVQDIRAVDSDVSISVEQNIALNNTLKQHVMAQIHYDTITLNETEIQIREVRPGNFDDSAKHHKQKRPVLFQVYGGPDSQAVDQRFRVQWSDYLASVHGYIVVHVDVRGSGKRGRRHRNVVTDRLGQVEVDDMGALASYYAQKEYVDATRMGVWGWSYGGYLTAKCMEGASDMFSLAMAVAPVTDWRLYDSIYTERYMSSPDQNANAHGYTDAAVRNVSQFHNFALAHGTGDDNVHFAHSAHLLDLLTQEGVQDFAFRPFTDSNHSIHTRGAYKELFVWLTRFLEDNWTKVAHTGKKG
ncbi:hypothetical protein E3P96_00603 [Wallemia ichthyophaga]|nr:hypothetical protein E3P96_00603 [Wallemia ichthyophaga]